MNNLRSSTLLLFALSGIFLIGCAARQDITQFQGSAPKRVCIAEHSAVRSGVRDAIIEGVRLHGSEAKVIPASYVERHGMWEPSVNPGDTVGCDAIMFYVANWTWDITTYMYFANIWVMNAEMDQRLAQATYQTGGGPDKWINARNKILELINQMYVSVGGRSVPLPADATEATNPAVSADSQGLSAEERLRKLKEVYDEGLITKEEYDKARKQVLEEF